MDKSNYPLILEVKHIQEILGVSQRRAYEIMEIEGFPLLRLGRSKRTPRDKFFEWLENQAS
jgi:hypothetical protein